MAIRDIQKCIHIINTYGTIAEIKAGDELRSLTYNRSECYEILNPVVDENLIKLANVIKLRTGKTEDWYMQDDPEIKIYNMDDCEYWISDLSEEETAKIYCEEYGLKLGEDINVEEIEECDLDNGGMYWNFETKEIDLLIKALLGDESSEKLTVDGSELYIANCDGTCIWVPYRRAIELDGPYTKPHMIACTEC